MMTDAELQGIFDKQVTQRTKKKDKTSDLALKRRIQSLEEEIAALKTDLKMSRANQEKESADNQRERAKLERALAESQDLVKKLLPMHYQLQLSRLFVEFWRQQGLTKTFNAEPMAHYFQATTGNS